MKIAGLFAVCTMMVARVGSAFVANHETSCRTMSTLSLSQQADTNLSSTKPAVSRRRLLEGILVGSAAATFGAFPVFADVSDGNVLPQGAQQFARVVRLKSDIAAVKKRLTDGADEIDKKEWDNIGKFLRNVYSVAEQDMKVVGKGIFNPDNKKRALNDVEQLKKYAQAGDVSVSKKDAANLATILDKCSGLVEDFLDSLSDVPDEL